MRRLSRVVIAGDSLAQVVALAVQCPQQEICGLMGGRFRRGGEVFVKRIYSIPNVASNPAVTFRLDERAQVKALYAIANAGDELVGIFHSHPNGPDRPSQSDIALNAYPEVAHCIIFPLVGTDTPYARHLRTVGKMTVGAWQLLDDIRPLEWVVNA